MYSEFYNLSGRPFQLTPDPRFYFDTRSHKKAMAYLTYGLNQGEGFIIITGDIGTGKTTLVGHLFDQLDPTQFVFAKVVTTQLDADDLVRMVAGAFGIPIDNMGKALLLQRLERFLAAQHKSGKRVLLIVDEAQNLPVDALEELRMLSNFQEGERALLQSFLLGQPEFRDKLFFSPDLEQLRQRVIATHHLEPMGPEEVAGYVEHRLQLVGWQNDPVFTAEAYQKIHTFSGGVPRRLNTLCSRILLFGALEELHEITGPVVDDVIIDLERDNTPVTGPKHVSIAATPKSQKGPLKRVDDAVIAPASSGPAQITDESANQVQTTDQAQTADHLQTADQLNGTVDGSDVVRRLEVLEQYVKAHDSTIKKTLQILTDWMDRDQESAGDG